MDGTGTGGETRAAKGREREGGKVGRGKKKLQSGDATDSLTAEFPATKFGAHPRVASPKNHCTSKYWSRNFPADIRFPGVSCFNVIDLFHLSYTIHLTLMNRVSNGHTRPNRPRTEGICVDMLFLKNIKNIWNIKVAIFVIN